MSISYLLRHFPQLLPTMIAPLMGGLAVFFGVAAFGQDVQVFTDNDHPVQAHAGIPVLKLDQPARIEAALSTDLPVDPAQAAALVRRRLEGGGATLQHQLGQAYQGVVQAWGLGVAKLPAVVVDGRYVVYGESDVDRALARIAAYREAQR